MLTRSGNLYYYSITKTKKNEQEEEDDPEVDAWTNDDLSARLNQGEKVKKVIYRCIDCLPIYPELFDIPPPKPGQTIEELLDEFEHRND